MKVMENEMNLNLRYIAQFVVQAETALNLSSGDQDVVTDSLIMTDANGLPMIPGTSLTGVLRRTFADSTNTKQIIDNVKENKKSFIDDIFGYQGKDNEGSGSQLIVSNGHFVGMDNTVIEGLQVIDWGSVFYEGFVEMPIREHCKISENGTAVKHGKFDNSVIYKGTRFKFELELMGTEEDRDNWNSLLNTFTNKSFRIGGGTRKGYGKLKVISANATSFDLSNDGELDAYLNKSARLTEPLAGSTNILSNLTGDEDHWLNYELNLTPEDFYSFGSGFGDEEVDMTPVYERVIKWNSGKPYFSNKKILIPASSVKGAISHRVAFHYNKEINEWADGKSKKELENVTGENNEAVKTLFGFAKDDKDENDDKKKGQRGNVIFSDMFIENQNTEKILNHVAIDRFTGGALDGALFDEKVITQQDAIVLELSVHKTAFENENVKKAFENTLEDIITGLLPMGGSTMRGHGCFSGTWRIK